MNNNNIDGDRWWIRNNKLTLTVMFSKCWRFEFSVCVRLLFILKVSVGFQL